MLNKNFKVEGEFVCKIKSINPSKHPIIQLSSTKTTEKAFHKAKQGYFEPTKILLLLLQLDLSNKKILTFKGLPNYRCQGDRSKKLNASMYGASLKLKMTHF